MKNFIIKQLNLKEDDIEKIDFISYESHLDITITLKVIPHVCPVCSCVTTSTKDYATRVLSNKIMISCDTNIYYRQRRMKCPNCGKTFVEFNPFNAGRGKLTQLEIENILKDLKPYNVTYSFVARKYDISVETVINTFDKHVQIERKILPEIMCFDEFYFNRTSKYKYAFLIMNFKNKLIIDVVESRRNEKLVEYFHSIPISERNNVKYIIIDMYRNYADLIRIFFKQAIICIDSFHVMKNINSAMDTIRKQVMRKYKDDKKSLNYKLLKYRYELLFKHHDYLEFEELKYDKITGYHISENGLVERILKIDSRLKKAYELKEMYADFNEITEVKFERSKQEEKLEKIIYAYITSGLEPFEDMGATLKKWKEEILNSFKWVDGRRLSNGPIEGKNNYIKKILSNANGMVNFKRARNRIMYSQNQYEGYSKYEKPNTIKGKGVARGKYKTKKNLDNN